MTVKSHRVFFAYSYQTDRQIGIWRTGLSTQEPAYQHHNTTNQEGNNTNPVA